MTSWEESIDNIISGVIGNDRTLTEEFRLSELEKLIVDYIEQHSEVTNNGGR